MSEQRSESSAACASRPTPDLLLQAAREYAAEGRESHVRWAEHLDPADPCSVCLSSPATMEAVGGYTEQMEWVRKYDVIVAALELLDETLAVRMVDAIARLADEETRKQACRFARHALRYRKEAHA